MSLASDGSVMKRTKLSTKLLSRGADQICDHETTDEKLNAGISEPIFQVREPGQVHHFKEDYTCS